MNSKCTSVKFLCHGSLVAPSRLKAALLWKLRSQLNCGEGALPSASMYHREPGSQLPPPAHKRCTCHHIGSPERKIDHLQRTKESFRCLQATTLLTPSKLQGHSRGCKAGVHSSVKEAWAACTGPDLEAPPQHRWGSEAAVESPGSHCLPTTSVPASFSAGENPRERLQ